MIRPMPSARQRSSEHASVIESVFYVVRAAAINESLFVVR
jgi:hypothetical protein